MAGLPYSVDIDRIPAYVLTLTPLGEIEFVNQYVLEFFGVPIEEFTDWRRVTHPDDVERVEAALARSLHSGATFDVESRGRRADGTYRWFHCRGAPLRDARGAIVRWCFVLADIDDRKRTEEALRASEHGIRLVVDSIAGLVCTNTREGAVESVNRTLLDYTGKSLEELRDWPSVVHPDDLPHTADRWQHSVTTGAPFDVEVRVLRADGVYRWFLCRGRPLSRPDGQIVRWYNLLTDIEDRRAAEELSRNRERDLRRTIDAIPACVWCAETDGRLSYVNNRLLNYAGTRYEEFADDPLRFVHPDDLGDATVTWLCALRSRDTYAGRYRMRRADGEYRWVQSLAELARDEHGHPTRWYGLVVDIHDQVTSEEALRAMRSRLARAAQAAAVGELSASIAHEVNQPLAAVVATAHACQGWLEVTPPNILRARAAVERIIRDGMAAADVVHRVRELFRHAPPNKNDLGLADVVAEVYQLMHADVLRRGIVLIAHPSLRTATVHADRVQLQQLLLNLVRNAAEALETVVGRPREVEVSAGRDDSGVRVSVRDTGEGMKDYAHAFDALFTTKPHGMGMGLAICRTIVEAHGGRLWATRAQPFGSIFCFVLPGGDVAGALRSA